MERKEVVPTVLFILGISLLLIHLWRRYSQSEDLGVPSQPKVSQIQRIADRRRSGEELELVEDEDDKIELKIVRN